MPRPVSQLQEPQQLQQLQQPQQQFQPQQVQQQPQPVPTPQPFTQPITQPNTPPPTLPPTQPPVFASTAPPVPIDFSTAAPAPVATDAPINQPPITTTFAPFVQQDQAVFFRGAIASTRSPNKPVPVSPLTDNNSGKSLTSYSIIVYNHKIILIYLSGDSNAGILPLQTETADANLLFPRYPPFR